MREIISQQQKSTEELKQKRKAANISPPFARSWGRGRER
jgi:hypothetical protein